MIDDLPRVRLAALPTAVTTLSAPGSPPLSLKRDDLTGFGVAGNKARPLEYLLGQAQAEGCRRLVGGGAPKSNFIAALALAARVRGLECELLVPQPDGTPDSPTVALARAVGARITSTPALREQLDELIEERAADLRGRGTPALAVPRGGATPVGAVGFARAAVETADQLGPEPLTVVVPVGSGGSVAGLAAGVALTGVPWTIVGVSVSRPLEEMTAVVSGLADATSRLCGVDQAAPVRLVDAREHDDRADREAALLALTRAGVLLDPVYGVRALPEALHMAEGGERVLLWLTGGLPSALDLASSASAVEVAVR